MGSERVWMSWRGIYILRANMNYLIENNINFVGNPSFSNQVDSKTVGIPTPTEIRHVWPLPVKPNQGIAPKPGESLYERFYGII